MHIFFKSTTENDLPFYSECFQNKEFQYMLYGESPLKHHQLANYIVTDPQNYKYVLFTEKQGEKGALGFAHFIHQGDNRFVYLGGIHPKFFDSGVGVYASVASLSLFFGINPNAFLETGIYKHNPRSLKIHLAIGFSVQKETRNKVILNLDQKRFDNVFVRRISERVHYSLLKT